MSARSNSNEKHLLLVYFVTNMTFIENEGHNVLGPILIIIKHQINSANQALMIWNNLPDNIQHCKSLALLRSTLSKTCAHTCIQAMCVCVYVYMYGWMYGWMNTCFHVYVHVCSYNICGIYIMCVCVCVCVCVCEYMDVCEYVCMLYTSR